MERILTRRITSTRAYIYCFRIISTAFKPVDRLIRENWADACENDLPVDEIFVNFLKAFDKIRMYDWSESSETGIKPSLLGWVEGFLKDRKFLQRVKNFFFWNVDEKWSTPRVWLETFALFGLDRRSPTCTEVPWPDLRGWFETGVLLYRRISTN